jgi:CDP-diacylglycerol--glycerol-3-phosphate 3-phosphatidyltransferase
MIDGAMARIKGVTSKFGALLDSSMDRVADAAIFGVVAYLYATRDQPRVVAAAVLALALGQVVSYVKARAEGLGATCNVGLVERTERLIIVGVGGLLTGLGVEPALEIALWVLVVLSLFTVWQRMRHVYLQMEQQVR